MAETPKDSHKFSLPRKTMPGESQETKPGLGVEAQACGGPVPFWDPRGTLAQDAGREEAVLAAAQNQDARSSWQSGESW